MIEKWPFRGWNLLRNTPPLLPPRVEIETKPVMKVSDELHWQVILPFSSAQPSGGP